MVEVRVWTSKGGRLWPIGYWKTLLDCLSRGGAKHDPRDVYPDLAKLLDPMIEFRDGKYFSRPGTLLCTLDDCEVRIIRVCRVALGREWLNVCSATGPNTADWGVCEVPAFRTPGSSKYEAQSKRNQAALASLIAESKDIRELSFSFRLSTKIRRPPIDLDNLFDALVPFFNRTLPLLDEIFLIKEEPADLALEALRYRLCTSDEIASGEVVATVVAINS